MTTPTYDPDPHVRVPPAPISGQGYKSLAETIRSLLPSPTLLSGRKAVVCLDIYHGPGWEDVVRGLQGEWQGQAEWFSTTDALNTQSEMDPIAAPYASFDPVFGRVCERDLRVFFNDAKWLAFVRRVQDAISAPMCTPTDIVFVTGPGALLPPLRVYGDVSVYAQVPREFVFFASEAGKIRNMCDDATTDRGKWGRYQRSFFFDWPVQMRHMVETIPSTDLVVDYSDPTKPTYADTDALLSAYTEISTQPFRVRSLFYPGVWGGQRLKELIPSLPKNWKNTAWGFELIFPENTLTIEFGGGEGVEGVVVRTALEFMLQLRGREVLGKRNYRRYGSFLPIRIDYLDTMGGTNLSCQVHPPDDYISAHFHEPFAQHESYYVQETRGGAVSYIGLTENTDKDKFLHDVKMAQEKAVPFDITKHVNAWPCKRGDVFMIPAGTVHCSGSENLVLEISATPWIYTFKIYDYLRTDLDGNPRPISYQRAFEVIDFTRKTQFSRENLVRKPRLISENSAMGYTQWLITDLPLVPYVVERIEFASPSNGQSFSDSAADGIHVLVCVHGPGCVVESHTGKVCVNYAETVIVPANAGKYQIVPVCGGGPVEVLKVYVHEGYAPRVYPRPGEEITQEGGLRVAIGVDVGGTGVRTALYAKGSGGAPVALTSPMLTPLDANGSRELILSTIANALIAEHGRMTDLRAGSVRRAPVPMTLAGIGIGCPGPFDYPNGICLIKGLAKYESIYGLNMCEELARRLVDAGVDLAERPIKFWNDALVAGVGGAGLANRTQGKAIYVCLGTGFGTCYLIDGVPAHEGSEGMPPNGWLYNRPTTEGGPIADEVFSNRGLEARCGVSVEVAVKMAREGDETMRRHFREFGAELGVFLRKAASEFGACEVLIGGGIVRGYDLFGGEVGRELEGVGCEAVPLANLGTVPAIVGACLMLWGETGA